jgi:hypothetical protein
MMDKKRSQLVTKSLASAALAALGFCNSARATLVIQEVYGDGGFAAGNTFEYDYVDLYNAGTAPVSLAGYVLYTGSYSNALYTSEPVALTGTVVAPGAYYLIEGHNAGTNPGTATFPTANQYDTQAASSGGLYPSYSAGKIALFDGTTLEDYVGYGDDESAAAEGTFPALPAFEGTGPAANFTSFPFFSGTNAMTRTVFTDATADGPDTGTENNATDFVSDTPNPQVTAVVPEPATLGLMAVGGAMMIARRRRK